MSHELVDATKRGKKYRLTFHVPAAEERESLRRGDYARLIFGDLERLWVLVQEVAEGSYRGVLASAPAVLRTIRKGDVVEFGPEHVVDIRRGGA